MAYLGNTAHGSGWLLWAGSAAVLLWPRLAEGEGTELGCASARIRVEDLVDARWRESIARLCAQLETISDLDPSAQLRIRAAGADIVVESVLRDGRSAQRRVQSPDELALTIEALAVLPPSEPAAATERDPDHSTPVAQSPSQSSPRHDTAPARNRLRVEFVGALLGRIEQTPTYVAVGLEAYANLCSGHWLFGLGLRWDVQEFVLHNPPPKFLMDSVGAGLFVGRRQALASAIDLDLGGNLLLASQTQSSELGPAETTTSRADIRIGLLARALFGSPPWRWTLTVETDLSPARLRQGVRLAPGLPMLPGWSLGAGLGAAWSDT
jgi:hypothetical protein